MNRKARYLALAALLLSAGGLGLLIPWISDAIESVGLRIYMLAPALERDYALADYLLSLGVAAAIAFGIVLFPLKNQAQRRDLFLLWLVRCLVTLVFMLFYEKHYSIDAFAYFGESLYAQPRYDINNGDTYSLFINLCWWINQNLLPFPSYHTQKLLFAFVGFLGSNLVYASITRLIGREERRALWVAHLLPSILFWSSILGKDPITFFAVSAYLYGVSGILTKQRFLFSIAWIALGVGISFILRPWMAGILAMPLLTVPAIRIKNMVARIIIFLLIPLALHFGTGAISKSMKVSTVTDALEATNQISRSWSRGGSGQAVPEFRTIQDVLAFAPIGMFTALFRPLPGEVMNPFGLLAGLENFLLIVIFVMGLRKAYRGGYLSDGRVVALLSVVLSWGFIYGFVSYQNLGAAVRFKLQVLPALVALIYFLNYYKDNTYVRNRRNH